MIKKYIQFGLIFGLIMIISSCAEDYKTDTSDLGFTVRPTSIKLVRVDTDKTIEIKTISNGNVKASTVKIYVDEKELSVVSPNIEDGKISFSSATLLPAGATDFKDLDEKVELNIEVTSSTNKVFTSTVNVEFVDGWSNTKKPDAFVYSLTNNDSIIWKKLEGFTFDKVELSWKKGKTGTYTIQDIASFYNTAKDLLIIPIVKFSNTTFNYDAVVGDTIYYQVTTTKGSNSDIQDAIKIPVTPQVVASKIGGILFNNLNKSKYTLRTISKVKDKDEKETEVVDTKGVNIADIAEGGDIKFKSDLGFEVVSTVSMDFVKIDLSALPSEYNTAAKFEAERTLSVIKNAYDTGAKVTEITGLEKDDVIVYRITRKLNNEDKDYYGYMIITTTSTSSVDGDGSVQEFGISYGDSTYEL